MTKLLLVFFAGAILAQTAHAEVTYRRYKTPNGEAYSGTFNSNGVSGGFGGGYSSDGYSGGYGGSIGGNPYGGVVSSGAGGGGIPFGPFPSFDAFINPGEFERLITGHLENLQKNHASGVSMIHATPGANAYASTSLTNNYNLYQNNIHQQQQLFDTIRQQVQAANAGSNYASASGSYGPGGIHQTASVYPPNPDSPNIDTRFAAEGPGAGGKPGFYGVSSSAFFESSNVDGVQKNRKGAVTTVNDNGKVTTYKSGF